MMNQWLHKILSMHFSGVNHREQDPTLESVIPLVLPDFEFKQPQGSFQKSSTISSSRKNPAILN